MATVACLAGPFLNLQTTVILVAYVAFLSSFDLTLPIDVTSLLDVLHYLDVVLNTHNFKLSGPLSVYEDILKLVHTQIVSLHI